VSLWSFCLLLWSFYVSFWSLYCHLCHIVVMFESLCGHFVAQLILYLFLCFSICVFAPLWGLTVKYAGVWASFQRYLIQCRYSQKFRSHAFSRQNQAYLRDRLWAMGKSEMITCNAHVGVHSGKTFPPESCIYSHNSCISTQLDIQYKITNFKAHHCYYIIVFCLPCNGLATQWLLG